ncbi:MAG: efflux RND transporter periplasmic adaptor subunit [Bacteroidales bacterium]|nr:efflux RND transporter periplasmic adaptor subunit [Bacteroidales bacterium]
MRTLNSLIFAAILLLAGCRPDIRRETKESKVLQVKLWEVELREYKLAVRAAGMLSTTTEMKLGFKTGGIVRKLNVKEGVSVKGGEILAELDLSEIDARVNQARISLEKAKRDLTRANNLYQDSVATLEQLQNARSAFELAQSQLRIADFNQEYSSIKAPSHGRIQKVLVETNEFIAPGYPAILFASMENDWVVCVALTDKDIVKFSLGDSALVEMDPFPDERFAARITKLGSIADPLTGTYEVDLTLIETNPRFRTGFIARADIFPTQTTTAAVVPLESLLEASDHSAFIYVYRDGEVSRRRIRTGRLMGDLMMVTQGVEPGELVVTEGAKYILQDSRVDPVNLDKGSDQ